METVESRGGEARRRKLPSLALLTSTIEGARLDAPTPETADAEGRIVEVRLDELVLDHQPREIVPEEELQRLIAAGQARPAALLACLQSVAAEDSYYAEILIRIKDLARSVAAEGVLQPIQIAAQGGRLVVRDGHRRCLASLLADKTTVPAVQVAEPGEVEAVARALIVNLQREDLTALEKGAALLRLALLVGRRLAAGEATGDAAASAERAVTLEALLGTRAAEDEEAEADATREVTTTVIGQPRALAARVRDRVCTMVGLQPRSYYRLLALNRLAPRARALARGLTENQLRPIVSLAAEDQVEVIAFAQKRGLSAKEIATLAGVVRSGDRDAVRRVMARLAKEEVSRQRAAVSWEPLLHAVPRDLWQRCQSLRSELEALPPAHRRARLDAMWEQGRLLEALHAEFVQIFAAFAYDGPGTPELAAGDE